MKTINDWKNIVNELVENTKKEVNDTIERENQLNKLKKKNIKKAFLDYVDKITTMNDNFIGYYENEYGEIVKCDFCGYIPVYDIDHSDEYDHHNARVRSKIKELNIASEFFDKNYDDKDKCFTVPKRYLPVNFNGNFIMKTNYKGEYEYNHDTWLKDLFVDFVRESLFIENEK